MKWRGFNEPRISLTAHHTGELARQDASGIMRKLFGNHGSWRQIVADLSDCPGSGRDARPVLRTRQRRIESRRQIRSARQHDMVPGRVIVGCVRQRTAEGPQVTSDSQARQMFTNLYSGSLSCDGREFAANFRRCLWLWIKAVMLRQTTGKENVDTRANWRCVRCGSRRGRPQTGKMINSQTQQADAARPNGSSPGNPRMIKGRMSMLHGVAFLLHRQHRSEDRSADYLVVRRLSSRPRLSEPPIIM